MTRTTGAFTVHWATTDRRPWLTGVVAALVAAAAGMGFLGVPHVDLHGPLHYLGIMDPLCGGTRATFLLTTGDFAGAARYNPIVFPLAVAAFAVLARGAAGLVTRRWLEFRLSPAARRILTWILVVAVAALSVRQQLEAELLTQAWPPPGR